MFTVQNMRNAKCSTRHSFSNVLNLSNWIGIGGFLWLFGITEEFVSYIRPDPFYYIYFNALSKLKFIIVCEHFNIIWIQELQIIQTNILQAENCVRFHILHVRFHIRIMICSPCVLMQYRCQTTSENDDYMRFVW